MPEKPGAIPFEHVTREQRTEGAVHKTQAQQVAEAYQRSVAEQQQKAAQTPELDYEQRRALGVVPQPAEPTGYEARRVVEQGEKTGPGEAVFSQFGRGLVDAILAPGALAGMAAEGAGELAGSEWLRDFGRDLGEASSGKSYLEAASFVFGGGLGDDTERALSLAEKTKKRLELQEQEWPTLSLLSRMAGQATLALGTGAAATGATGARALAAMGAYEGAGGGAQAAYENSAPLTDVLASAILGAGIGGAAGYGGGKLAEHFAAQKPKLSDLGAALGAEVKRGARNVYATVEEAGGVQAKRVIDELMGAKTSIAKAIREAGPNPTARETAEAVARSSAAERITGKVAGSVDDWARREPDALQKFVRRKEYLDRIADDLSRDFETVARMKPSLDYALDPGRLAKHMDDADAPLAIGRLQERIRQASGELPDSPDVAAFGVRLHESANKLAQTGADRAGRRASRRAYRIGAAEAMNEGHELLRTVRGLGASRDPAVRAYAERLSQELYDDLSSEAFGGAGKLYRQSHVATDQLEPLSRPEMLRENLRRLNTEGELLDAVHTRNNLWQQAYQARREISGENVAREAGKSLENLTKRVRAAERVLTLDGKSSGRVLDFVGGGAGRLGARVAGELGADAVAPAIGDRIVGMLAGGAVGGVPGMALGFMVSNYVAPYINRALRPIAQTVGRHASRVTAARGGQAAGELLSTAHVSTGHAAYSRAIKPVAESSRGPRPTRIQRHERYRERIDQLTEFSEEESAKLAAGALTYIHDAPPEATRSIAQHMNTRVLQLMQDIPKPRPHIGGRAFEVLSNQDLKRSEAMWEATFNPMGMFDDFERGIVNYERIEYTYKQYPGLKQAVQAGIHDALFSQIDDPSRVKIPGRMIAQYDFLGGFGGSLHDANSPELSQFITKTNADAQKKAAKARPNPPPMSKSPLAEHMRSYSSRLAH